MFTVQERDRVRDHVLELARNDPRVVAGAEVGSLALGGGDRWSDLDLTFSVTDGLALTDVLDDWTRDLISRFDAVHLLDLVADLAIYRVFLLPRLPAVGRLRVTGVAVPLHQSAVQDPVR